MIETQEELQNRLIMDAMRNDLLSYAMGIYPDFKESNFATSVAYEIQKAMEGKNQRLILQAPPQHGKPCNYLKSLTFFRDGQYINGIYGDIELGDKVLNHDGKFYDVTGHTKNDPVKLGVRVTLQSGESFDTHENHEWLVYDVQETRNQKKAYRQHKNLRAKKGLAPLWPEPPKHVWRVIETKELLESISVDNKPVGKRGSRYRYQTPRCQKIELPEVNLSVDPYWFGYWLGDGNSNFPLIVVGEQDYDVCKKHLSSIYDISSEQLHPTTKVVSFYFGYQNLHQYLPINSKHIPDEYKLSSVEQRKQLLAGLIDSDGFVYQKNGRVVISNTNKRLVDDICFVIRSLGWNVSTPEFKPVLSSSGIEGKQSVWQIGFNPSEELPTIYERKKIKVLKEPDPFIAIVGAERIPEDEQELGFCIEVDSPDHTYVIGDTFITTHNSFMTSEIAPAWFMGRFPKKKIITASHTKELASKFGLKVRENILHPVHGAVFGWDGQLSPKKQAADEFYTNAGGEYFAVGVGGTPIGHGADVYIIDDPIRSRSDVQSESQREELKQWWSSAVMSRLVGDGNIILMHQRWHEDDLAGWLVKESPDMWRVVNFPALIEDEEDLEADYLGRSIGQPLVPQLHSKEKLEMIRDDPGFSKMDWYSMYQQKPRGASGDKFTETMIQRYTSPPREVARSMNVYIIVDPCGNENKKKDDYAVFAVIGVGADGNFYILDMVREKLELTERGGTLIELHRKWRPINTYYESYGAQSDIQAIKMMQEMENYRFPIQKIKDKITKGSKRKEARIERLIPDMIHGKWYAPEFMVKIDKNGKEYDPIERMIQDEMLPFPVGKHDDGIDCISRIYDIPIILPSSTPILVNTTSKRNKVSPW